MPDFRRFTVSWGGGHGLSRAIERGVTPHQAERIIATSTDLEASYGDRWVIWGCVNGRRAKVIVKPIKGDTVIVVSVVRTGKPCS